MFYLLIFCGLALLLVVVGLTQRDRIGRQLRATDGHGASASRRQQRKAQRAQSRNDRRRRH